jgi:hypothetical protein
MLKKIMVRGNLLLLDDDPAEEVLRGLTALYFPRLRFPHGLAG